LVVEVVLLVDKAAVPQGQTLVTAVVVAVRVRLVEMAVAA